MLKNFRNRIYSFMATLLVCCLLISTDGVYLVSADDANSISITGINSDRIVSEISGRELLTGGLDDIVELEATESMLESIDLSGALMPSEVSFLELNCDEEKVLFNSIPVANEAPVKTSADYTAFFDEDLDYGEDILSDTDGYSNHYAFEKLSKPERLLYGLLDKLCKDFTDGEKMAADVAEGFLDFGTSNLAAGKLSEGLPACVILGAELTVEEVKAVYQSFYYDHPQYFWLYSGYAQSRPESGIGNVMFTYLDGFYGKADYRVKTAEAIERISESWLEELGAVRGYAFGDVYEAVRKTHDLIIDAVNYTNDASGSPSKKKYCHNVAGVFTGEGAVCEGYARAFQFMLNLMDIPNIYIVGTAGGGGHAWNAVGLDDKWYLVDVTWDDFNEEANPDVSPAGYYNFFCIPESSFNRMHTAGGKYWMYELPAFENTTDQMYYTKYNAFAEEAVTADNLSGFVDSLIDSKPEGVDFYLFAAKRTDDIDKITKEFNPSQNGFTYYSADWGYFSYVRAKNVEYKADRIEVSDKYTVDIGKTISINPVLYSEEAEGFGASCDDMLVWELSGNLDGEVRKYSDHLVVHGADNGTIKVKVKSLTDDSVSASFSIIVGSGVPSSVIWAGGNKDYKSVILKTSLSAENWKDAKGKTKKGKLTWVLKNEPTEIEFSDEKHTILTKSDKNLASIVSSNKGKDCKVTAKSEGTIYVYACDTGKMRTEEFTVTILNAPSSLKFSTDSTVADKEHALTKTYIDCGETEYLYVIPTKKQLAVSENCQYKLYYTKAEDEKHVAFTQPQNAGGGIQFSITGLLHDKTKGKAYTAKLLLMNIESGKTAVLSVNIYNAIVDVIAQMSDNVSLVNKGDSFNFNLDINTSAGEQVSTTDKIKLYVGLTDVSLDENKIVVDKGATVKVKFDKKLGKYTASASKKAGNTAVVYAAITNSYIKDTELFPLFEVTESGEVIVYK